MNYWNTAGSSFKRSQFVKTSTQLLLVFAVLVSLVASAVNVSPTHASGSLTIEPLTWNVIGLDSNLVTVGPEHFPIGARVCNTSVSASTVSVTYNWTDGLNKYTGDTYINLRAGTLDVVSLSIPAGQCKDAYFEVAVTRNSSAYNKTRAYTITANDGAGGTATTTTPRELLVEHLISQSRNSVTDMQLSSDGSSYSSVAPGGTMTLMVGQTYWIKLVGSTATNGYEQIETFINFPNTIFQVLSTNTTYTAESSATLNPPYDKLYGDGCVWENNPLSPNYRSCLSTGKAGGDITVTYQVKIISVPSTPLVNPEPLSTLIYDFSGSSYHYNADFSSSVRFANIVNASIAKAFSPKTIKPGENSTLTYTITNPGPASLSDVNFADTALWPAGMTVASTTVTPTGCGTPSPSSLTVGATSASFSGITVAAYGTCTIAITVTASTNGTYADTTNHLFINSTIDTGSFGADTLVVSSKPAAPSTCGTPTTLVTWDFGTAAAPTLIPTINVADVSLATASGAAASPGAIGTDTADGNPASSYKATNWATTGTITPPNPPNPLTYFQFDIDTTNYNGVSITFDYKILPGDWANIGNNFIYVYSDTSTSGSPSWSSGTGYAATKGNTFEVAGVTHTAATTGTTRTRFFVGAAGAKNSASALNIDNVIITGCPRPTDPTLSKAFSTSPITTGNTSTLTFTFTNPNSTTSLTGVDFTDKLPSGLVLNTPNGLSGPTCSTGSISGQSITATAGSRDINMSAATLAANSSCSFSVNVKGVVAGTYNNLTSRIASIETGPNFTGGANVGYGSASLTVIDPPVISKVFGTDTIFTNGTTTLKFTISNPNPTLTLTGVNFVGGDTLPSGLVVATPNGQTAVSCSTGSLTGQTITATAGSSSVTLTGGDLTGGATCTFSVNVTGTTTGIKTNLVQVGSTNGGTGNTSTAQVLVKDLTPALSLKKQVSTSASGPWRDSMIIAAGSNAYYKFTVENTGDVPLSSVNITDPTLNGEESCAFTNPLPVAVAANDNHIDDCIIGPITPTSAGYVINTAQAFGSYSAFDDVPSNTDQATYQNGNFGHLPSAYTNMNLYNEGGAFHLNGATFFGASETTNATDGINTPTYTFKSTDNGIYPALGVNWAIGVNGGSLDITVACPGAPAQPCYMNAWIDWDKNNDFNDPGEQIFTNYQFNSSGTFTSITFNIPAGTVFDGSIFYSRFRLYDQLPTNPQPNGQAYNGTTPLYGEIEDPFFRVSSTGDVTTPVTLSYFKASREGNSVQFDWSTATETGNVGFNLYVKQNGKLVQINEELIFSQAIDSLERLDYNYIAEVIGNTFYVEDVSVLGETRRHGPFQVGEAYGVRLDAEKIDWSAIQRESQGQGAETLRLKPDLEPGAAKASALNLKVSQTGLYRVTYEMLRDAGLDLGGVALTKINISNRGKAVPIYVMGQKGRFGAGAYFEFYGQALDTMYTDTNVYTLQVMKTSGSRIAVTNVSSGRVAPPASYQETLVVNRQRVYASYTPSEDPWYDTTMMVYKTPKSWSFPFEINGLANANASANLDLTVWGVTSWPQSPDHHLVVKVNGVTVGDQTFDGLVEQKLNVTLPGGTLHDGTNTLELTLPGDTGASWDTVTLDKFSVSYPRVFQARDGKLTFTATGKTFRVNNLPTPNVVVYRMVKDVLVKLGQVNVEKDGNGGYQAIFAGNNKSATYMVSTVEALNTPVLEVVRQTANLKRPAEYLVIAHPNFIAGIQPLVAARQAQGLTVSVVDVTDLYTTYSNGIFDPKAIQEYIAYSVKNLGTKYVLLVGGDTYDYRNYLGKNSISFIPSLYVATSSIVKYVPSDPLYADMNRDNVPDVAIGRFPVRTAAELDILVQKTLAYGNKTYNRTAVFAADKSDSVSYKNISARMVASLPGGWSMESLNLDDMPVTTARTQLLAAMNRGTALVTYTGHSAPTMWNFSGLFTTTQANALTNAGKPFVAVQWGCWNNYYVDPVNNTLVQSLLVNGDRGAVAMLGAGTLVEADSEALLGQLLMPRLTKPGQTIGDALLQAKVELAQTHPDLLDVILGWSLLGDPALVVQP